jgi:hypothetical protein
MEIEALSQRLENRADSIVNSTPSQAGDLRAAALLLQLLSVLSDVEAVEAGPICLPDRSRLC